MQLMLSVIVGILYACGLYLLMRRSLLKIVLGLALISHGANLLIMVAQGGHEGIPPLLGTHGEIPEGLVADPLPQALVLTAIVISFAVTAFAVVLLLITYRHTGTGDVADLAERRPE
jgi:multicomponent Na+:H+ antiporter subunit C